MIDAYLKRPEGLVWLPDSSGAPAYMSALQPLGSFKLNGAISAGSNVPANLGNGARILQVGDVVVLDRAVPGSVEACVIATTSQPGTLPVTVTFQTVLNAHADQATADYGLVIEEQRYMPADRPLTNLMRTPVTNVLSGVGRYAYGRRGDGANYNMEQFNLLAAVSKFGGPPVWELFQATYPTAWDPGTGQLWIPAGIMLAYYSEVKIRYVAGFPASALPGPIKEACAALIVAMAATPGMGSVKKAQAGDTSLEFFTASVLSEDVKQAIQPYAARMYV